MLNFVFILAILLEIILCSICVAQLVKLEKKVVAMNEKLVLTSEIILDVNKQIKQVIQKINKVVAIFRNKKILAIGRILKISIDIIQVAIFIKSLDFSKGVKSINYKNIKRVIYAEIIRRVIVKTADFINDYKTYCKQEG